MKHNMQMVYANIENAKNELVLALNDLSNYIKVDDTVFHGVHFEDFKNRINNQEQIINNYIIPAIPEGS